MAERIICPVKTEEQGKTVYCSTRMCITRKKNREVLPCVVLQEARDSRNIIEPMTPIRKSANDYLNNILKLLGRLN